LCHCHHRNLDRKAIFDFKALVILPLKNLTSLFVSLLYPLNRKTHVNIEGTISISNFTKILPGEKITEYLRSCR